MSDYYNIDGMKRLFAVSVGDFNKNTPMPNHSADRCQIVKTFSKLGYRPTQTDTDRLTLDDAKKMFAKFTSKLVTKEHLAPVKVLVVYLKSHGSNEKDGIYMHFSDEKVQLWKLLEPLLTHPATIGIPKLIIFEACRGTNYEAMIPAFQPSAEPIPSRVHSRIDTALFTASTEGQLAVTSPNPEILSPFTRAICDSLDENPLTDITSLKCEVAKKMSTCYPQLMMGRETKTIVLAPVLEDCLTKRLRLKEVPVVPSDDNYRFQLEVPEILRNGRLENSPLHGDFTRRLYIENEKLIRENQELRLMNATLRFKR